MAIVRRLREAGAAFLARRLPGRAVAFSAALPGGAGPWLRFEARVDDAQQAAGRLLSLRAHWQFGLRRGGCPELSSWLDLRASDVALDAGSQALVPERLAELGVTPPTDRPVQTWAGALRAGHPGFGVLSLLRLDKKDLPEWLQRRLGGKPFALVATLATAVEEPAPPR